MKKKGISSVVAIVLLIFITVGAVGALYNQYENLLSNDEAVEKLKKQQRLQSASYSIIGVKKDSSDEIAVTIKNTGEVTFELDRWATIKIGKDETSPQAISTLGGSSNSCYNALGSLEPSETGTCSTGVSWPSSSTPTTIQVLVRDNIVDSYTCSAGEQYC